MACDAYFGGECTCREAELAQVRATLTAIELLLGKRDDETGWDAIKRLQTELAQAGEALNTEALNAAHFEARYREALEQLKHLPDAYGGKIVRAALARETEPEDKPTYWLPHGYHEEGE